MTDLYSSSSSISPLTAILWCFYPVAVLVIIEILLGGGFDDDNNDDQDGGMLIPAYSRSNIWNFFDFKLQTLRNFQEIDYKYWYDSHFPHYTYNSYHYFTLVACLENS